MDTKKTPASFLSIKTSNKLKNKIPMTSDDNPSELFGSSYEININNLPLTGQSSTAEPWSGSYWAMRYGGISIRYECDAKNSQGVCDPTTGVVDPDYIYTQSVNFYSQPAEHNEYYGTPEFQDYVNSYYSCAEKYDLLVGDFSYTLTNKEKQAGAIYLLTNGDIASWIGYCHGWTPAAIYEKKPMQSVVLTAADGVTQITFFPDDVKGLITLWWAQAYYDTDFMGEVCENTDPTTIGQDASTGIYTQESCASVNPASFHIAFGNQLGLKAEGIVYDPDPDGQIWNQPVYSYSWSYFRITDGQGFADLADAKVPLSTVQTYDDKFLQFFSENATAGTVNMVGVIANVVYIVESSLYHGVTDGTDFTTTKTSQYELELDANDNIIGGQWYSNDHPNFIWNVHDSSAAYGTYDAQAPTFDGSVAGLNALKAAAVLASGQNTVLRSIANYLLDNSAVSNSTATDGNGYAPSEASNDDVNNSSGVAVAAPIAVAISNTANTNPNAAPSMEGSTNDGYTGNTSNLSTNM